MIVPIFLIYFQEYHLLDFRIAFLAVRAVPLVFFFLVESKKSYQIPLLLTQNYAQDIESCALSCEFTKNNLLVAFDVYTAIIGVRARL